MLEHLLDLWVVANLFDLVRCVIATLDTKRLGTGLIADRDDPHAARPSLELPHQLLGQVLGGLRQRIELDIAGLEMDEPHLLEQSMLQLEIAFGFGERHDIVEAPQLQRRRGFWRRRRILRLVIRTWWLRGLRRSSFGLGGGGLAGRFWRRRGRRPLASTRAFVHAAGELGRRRQVRGISEPDENHVGGGKWAWARAHLIMSL